MDLESLKYSELQKLAKSVGIKANQKTEKLLKALKDYYSDREANENGTSESNKTTVGASSPRPVHEQGDSSAESTQPQEGGKKSKRRSTFELEEPSLSRETGAKGGTRRNTFELNEPALGKIGTPSEAGEKGRKKRRSTFELDNPSLDKGTPRAAEAQGRTRSSTDKGTPSGLKERKRHSTFKLDKPSLGAPVTPEISKPVCKTPSDADKSASSSKAAGDSSSPGVQTMLDSMSGEMNSAERKKRLMDAIDKKVEGKMKNSPQVTSNIPRFAAFLAKRNQEQKKPVTPGNKDWEKVHKKAFAKFDSLDVYLEKKRKRTEDLTASVKKARTVLHEVQEAVTKLKNKRTPSLGKKQADAPFKPTVTSTKNISFNFGASSGASQKPKTPLGRRSTHSAAKPFKPTVVSTKDMNLNFTASKTPSNGVSVKAVTKQRGSGCGVRASNNQHPHDTTAAGNVSTRKSFATPFKFTGNLNTSQAKSTTKPAFDLKASLARPITWKPHTGKLKPMDYSLYGGADAANRSVSKASSNRHLDMYKSHKTNPRAGRRAAAAAHRTEQKGRLQMKRRGISAAP
ncbi:hypothetical protein BaRGS_00028411 [Batillaria attramentaria]|uniref:Nucleolar and spindle-associated protein 1 n=1 Tax=Batillaria attramentaria TaxID=370345 RepID=A0ABD0JZC0_9CAEN